MYKTDRIDCESFMLSGSHPFDLLKILLTRFVAVIIILINKDLL